jgi:predicted ArsR family transcriptional regulator
MNDTFKLDEVIHQPIRTKIIAYLINRQECDYTTLKKTLNLSDGHMTTHMRVLLSKEYISMKKEFIKNKPKTTYSITQKGKEKFKKYIETLKIIINPEI